MSLPTKLLTAAMASSRQVHVQWNPDTNGVYVHWWIDDNYQNGQEYSDFVYLDYPNADEKLAEILETVEALG